MRAAGILPVLPIMTILPKSQLVKLGQDDDNAGYSVM